MISNKFGVKILDRISLKIKSFITDAVRSFDIKNNRQLVLKNNGNLELYRHFKKEKTQSFAQFDPKSAIFYRNTIFVLSQGKGIIQSKDTNLQVEKKIAVPGFTLPRLQKKS